MSLLIILQTVILCCVVFFGFYAFFLNRRASVNRVFLAWSIAAASWAISVLLMSLADTASALRIYYKASFFCFLPYLALFLHFSLRLAREKINKYHYILIYLIPVVLVYATLTGYMLFIDFEKTGDLWRFKTNIHSNWTTLALIYRQIVLWVSIASFVIWRRNSRKNREKKQALVLIISLFFIDVVNAIVFFLLPESSPLRFFGVGPLLNFVWVGGVFYSIIHYQFMRLTPALVMDRLLDYMNECIILLNEQHRIIFMNRKTEDLLDCQRDTCIDKHFSNLFLEHAALKKAIDTAFCSGDSDFSCRLHLKDNDNETVLMDAKFSRICDNFNDPLGILVVGHEVKEIKQFNRYFKMTRRETDIVQQMLIGKTNSEIAQLFSISLRTVKTHITNIYNKLKVNNKIEMMHLLKNYHLIPEQSSSRIILPIHSD